jgi:hypothetical protein
MFNHPTEIRVKFPHVEFTTSAYATHQYDRQFYDWSAVDFSESSHEHLCVNVRYHFPIRPHRDTWEDDQLHTLSGEHVQIQPEMEPFGLENAFGMLLWQQMLAALPSQNPYVKCISQYLVWKNCDSDRC